MGTLEYSTTTTKFQGGEKLENETRYAARKVYGRYQSGKRYSLKSGNRGQSQKGRRLDDNKDKSRDARFGSQDLRVPSRFYLPPSRGAEAERRRREEREELERRKKEVIERRRKLELERRKMRETPLQYGGRIQPQVNVAFGSKVPRYEASSLPTSSVRKTVQGTVPPVSSGLRRETGLKKVEALGRREPLEEPESTRDRRVLGSLWRKGPSGKKSEMYKQQHPQELETRATQQNIRAPGARSAFNRESRRTSCFV